jgi:hypothetical protein
MGTKLTDFTSEELRVILGAVIYKKEELKSHVKLIESHGEDFINIMADQRAKYYKEIDMLTTAEIQVATAFATVKMEENTLLN